jgi:hypothetical protein
MDNCRKIGISETGVPERFRRLLLYVRTVADPVGFKLGAALSTVGALRAFRRCSMPIDLAKSSTGDTSSTLLFVSRFIGPPFGKGKTGLRECHRSTSQRAGLLDELPTCCRFLHELSPHQFD